MLDVLNGIAAVVAIVGAIVSWRHAVTAKGYAERAESQVASGRRITDLTRLEAIWDETYKSLAVFGPAAAVDNLRGKSPGEAARNAQDYLAAVQRYRSSLPPIDGYDKRIGLITRLVGRFSSASDVGALKDAGTKLLSELTDLDAAIHSAAVAVREKVSLT